MIEDLMKIHKIDAMILQPSFKILLSALHLKYLIKLENIIK